ncbi:sugar kinase [Longispora fulva]|uniref:2-dehydro-3-deoxygluconokinase n=1 Tax=Longispora fulva TaxID=619741 RepID=A0A8J7GNJ0_9ACTN|nr:sugar kinase [Longispora fulva]MBG6133861.1 2-dehydro-3-deoxygluconokinase [Longispora fulva]GIG62901.1 sugar kinase [Longispora fulva]
MTDVLTFGEVMGALRADGPLRLGGPLGLSVAGAEATVAIGLARLGHDARWIGVTGADELGELVRRTLRAERVDTSGVRIDSSAPTGLFFLENRLAGLTRVAYHRAGSAGSRLTADDVLNGFADGATRILHVTGITCALGPGPRKAVVEAVAMARAMGTTVCLDVNHRSALWSQAEAAACLRPLLPSVDVLVASDEELPVVADNPNPANLLGYVDQVVVKHGAAGATVYTRTEHTHVPARVVTAVDTTGAGDAFVAGYLSGLLDGLGVADRLQRAVTVAGFGVATVGDWQGLPTRDELPLLDHASGSTLR